MFFLFNRLVEVKIEIESRLHCIDIYDDDCSKTIFLDTTLNTFQYVVFLIHSLKVLTVPCELIIEKQ